jgi:hypothetical protein
MIKIENVDYYGFDAALRGMRNPLNSWEKSDSQVDGFGCVNIGANDFDLMKRLVKSGSDHSKFMRMITVTCDITAPRYWWAETDTYKVGTVRNSCSTMHTIHKREFTLDDFSHDHLCSDNISMINYAGVLDFVVDALNAARNRYLETGDKRYWWQIIQLLPQSYNQRATWQANYAVLRNIYHARKNHKLDEWRQFCEWVHSLPMSELITDNFGGSESE